MQDLSVRSVGVSAAAFVPHERKTFLTLHALRGVAAVSVVVYHLRIWFPGVALVSNAYLAVDFFSCSVDLSSLTPMNIVSKME